MKTTTAEVGATALRGAVPRLTVLFANQRILDTVCVLTSGDWPLGRGADFPSGLPILAEDLSVSRLHARLRVSAGDADEVPKVELIDCGSRFGTFVNGRPVRKAWLADNDVLRLGHALLHLRHVPTDATDGDAPTLVGQSPHMAAVRWQVAAAGLSASAVLVEGELGTGKEVTARALHHMWEKQGRKDLFVAFNCAELSQELAASTLFGHVRGAFTGAQDSRPGLFRSAEGGTLFLDEIGELPLDVQPMLLRALEERRIAQVGREDRLLGCDVRIVAATNRDLTAAVAAGRFRADLHSRLDALRITLPALRHRREEVLPLLRHLWRGPLPRIHWDVAEALLLDPWPHNVRGLRNLVDHIKTRVQVSKKEEVTLKMLEGRIGVGSPAQSNVPDNGPGSPPSAEARTDVAPGKWTAQRAALVPQHARDTEQRGSAPSLSAKPPTAMDLQSLLVRYGYNLAAVGRHVGRSARQIRRWMADFGLARPDATEPPGDEDPDDRSR